MRYQILRTREREREELGIPKDEILSEFSKE
jgi:hypothetical protein